MQKARSQDSNQSPPIISMRSVSKAYGDNPPAIHDISLDIGAGEIVAIIGSSGAGKSTLMRLLNAMTQPTDGQVTVLGQPLANASTRQVRAVRKQTGFIFQSFGLVPRLTALENVLIGGLGRLRGPRYGLLTYPAHMKQRAQAELDRVGLGDRPFQRTDSLSGGQQQRVAIARAMFQDPVLVVADEPVASLDPKTSESVLALLREVCEERQATVVCSLHQVELALSWADRIIGLRGGSVAVDEKRDSITLDSALRVYDEESDLIGTTDGVST